MIILSALVLATTVKTLEPCSKHLAAWETRLPQWAAETRYVAPDFEQHRYHTVKRDGTTVFLTVVATPVSRGPGRELVGYKADSACEFDGREGVVMFKVEVRK